MVCMNSVILKFIAHETIEFLSENYLQLKQFYNMINFKRLILMPNIFGGKNRHDMVTSTLCFAQCANCFYIFTARKRSLRRLCFHRYLSVHREGCGRTRGRHSPGRHPPAQCMLGYTPSGYYRIRSTSGRYTSHWNAFLFSFLFVYHGYSPVLATFTCTNSIIPVRSKYRTTFPMIQ